MDLGFIFCVIPLIPFIIFLYIFMYRLFRTARNNLVFIMDFLLFPFRGHVAELGCRQPTGSERAILLNVTFPSWERMG